MFKPFVAQCLDGLAKPEDIDRWVSAWHASVEDSEGLSLDEYLGFSKEEGDLWARHPSKVNEIIENRRRSQAVS